MECHLLWHFIISQLQLHSLLFHYYFHVHYCHMYGYVMLKSFRQHHSSNMLPTYVATKKLNKLDDFNFKKRGIGIESDKYANKLEIKKVWKQVNPLRPILIIFTHTLFTKSHYSGFFTRMRLIPRIS